MVVVTKSTVPVGTNRALEKVIRAKLKTDVEFDMASNPEFLREGSSIEDFMRPDRVVIGVDSERSEELMREIYRPLYMSYTHMVKTGIETAELVKYASNSFLAVKISFINEIAKLAEAVGADVFDVAKAMGLDKRIGRKFLHPGLGFGGSCLPKDTNAIVHIAEEAGSEMSIVKAAIEVNRNIPERAMAKAMTRRPWRTSRVSILVSPIASPPTRPARALIWPSWSPSGTSTASLISTG
jgi:UDPglucose 6-dehydrogenase